MAGPPARRVRTGRSVRAPATSAPAVPRSRGSRCARSTSISISMSAVRPWPAVPATASPASARSPGFAPGRPSVSLGRQRRSVRRMRIVISTSFPARPASSWGVGRAARLAVPAMSPARNRVPSGQHGRRPGGALGYLVPRWLDDLRWYPNQYVLSPRHDLRLRARGLSFADNAYYHCRLTFAHCGVRWGSPQPVMCPVPNCICTDEP